MTAVISERMKRDVVAHYESRLERHGPTAEGMDWKDEASQRLRFAVLCDGIDLAGRSLLEVGAGAGHLCDFLLERGAGAEYHGIDLSERMVEEARRLHPEVSFEVRDLLTDPPSRRYDVVFVSGLFHVKLDHPDEEWRSFVHETLHRMWDLADVGIGFNLMSDQVEFRTPALHYADPGEVLAFCRRELSRWTALRHDYPLHEFTVHVYRNALT